MTLHSSTSHAGTYGRAGTIHAGALALAQTVGLRPATGATAQVVTLTITSPSSGVNYAISVTPYGGSAQVITVASTSTTAADLVALFLAACKANAAISGACSLSSTSSTLVFTDRTPGTQVTTFAEVTDAGGDLAFSTTTAGADASTYTFSRVYPTSVDTARGGERTVSQPSTLAGPVLTLTQTHDASGAYSLDVTATDPLGRVVTYVLSWEKGANAAGTDDNAEAELLAEMGTLVAIANPSTGVVTATFPVGYRVGYADATATGGSAALVPSVTTGSATPSAPALILRNDDPSETIATVRSATRSGSIPLGFLRGAGVQLVVDDPGAAVTEGDPVWVDSATGALKASAAPGYYMHPSLTWIARSLTNVWGDTVALVEAA